MVLGKPDATCQRTTLHSVYTTHKSGQKPSFPHQALPLLGPLKTDTLSGQPHTRTFSLLFLTFSLSGITSRQVLGRPGSCQREMDPMMSQSWSPSGSWGDPASVSVDSTPGCPEGWPSAWTQPRVFQKPKPQRVLRRRVSRRLRGEPSPQAECAFLPRVREAGSRSLPANGNVQTKPPPSSGEAPPFKGTSAASAKLWKFKLKYSQVSHDFSTIVKEQLTGNCMKWNDCRHKL